MRKEQRNADLRSLRIVFIALLWSAEIELITFYRHVAPLERKDGCFSPLIRLCGPALSAVAAVGGRQMRLLGEACSLQWRDVYRTGGAVCDEFRHT